MNNNSKSNNSLNAPLFIDPVNALLVMETENLLSDPIEVTSPLRRPLQNSSQNDTIPVYWDSRDLPAANEKSKTGLPQFIFVARSGAKFDGHSLIEDILAQGNIFVGESSRISDFLIKLNRPADWISEVLEHPHLIKVTSTSQALYRLLEVASQLHCNQFVSIGVTGTNGKTSVTQISSQMIENITQKQSLRIGTLGIQIGPETIEGSYPTMPDYPGFIRSVLWAKKNNVQNIVLEATSHGLSEDRLGSWKLDVGIFTNLTQDHLDYHGTMQKYRAAKSLLFDQCIKSTGTAVINTDDPEWEFFAHKALQAQISLIGFGTANNKDNFFALTARKNISSRFLLVKQKSTLSDGLLGTWSFENEKGALVEVQYQCPLIGDFQHENLAASACAMLALGFPLNQIAQTTSTIKGIPGRLEAVVIENKNQSLLPLVLVDYAHSPDALEKAILTLNSVKKPGSRVYCVFGCGGDRDASKRPIMGKIASENADYCIITSDNPRTELPEKIIEDILKGITNRQKVIAEVDRRTAITQAILNAEPHDIVLIAGKGHENYQILGQKKYPFSDVQEAMAALEQKIAK